MLGERQHRIILMAEDHIQGAGGRLTKVYLVIADVWASVGGDSSQNKASADRQYFGSTLSFETPYFPAYMNTRRIQFKEQNYSVTAVRKTFGLHPMISFDVVAEGDQLAGN